MTSRDATTKMTNSYLVLARVSGTTDKLVRTIKGISEKPSPGVKVIGTWTTFGAYDACIAFNANSEQAAMDFVQEHIRSIEGLLTTETLVGVAQAEYTPSQAN